MLSLLTGGGGNNNYYHWLYDALPRIGLCECAVDLNRIDYLLVPALAYPFQRQTLALLNIEPTRLISSADVRHLTAQRLLVTDHPNPESDNPPPWITHWLRSKFRPEGIVRSDFNTRIYIDRSDSLSKRRVVNEEEILDFLRTEGFSTYRLTELSVAEQVCLFSRAHAVVGVHGAGFANLAFSRPGTKVIELLSTRFMFNTYKQIARANSLNYSSFVSDVVEQNELPYDASFVVPLAEIRRHF